MATPNITYWKRLADGLDRADPGPKRQRATRDNKAKPATINPVAAHRQAAKDKEYKPPAVCPGPTQVHVMGNNGDIFISPRLLELAFRAGWSPKVNRAFATQWHGRPACAFEVDAASAERLAWTLVCARTEREWCCACGITIGKYWPNCIRGLVRTCTSPGLFLVFLDIRPPEEA